MEAETSSTCLLEKESDFRSLEGDAVVGTLPRGLIVASAAAGQSKEIGGQKWIRIEYPKQGWILSSICQPVSESQVCNEKNRLARTFNTGDHILGSCVASPSSNWVDQWPVGGSKLGAMVGSGGTFGLEIVPFSIADLFFMNSNHMTGNVNFQKEYVVGSPHEKSFSEFKSARSSFQKGDLVGADKHLKEMKQEATGRFEYIGDIPAASLLAGQLSGRSVNGTVQVHHGGWKDLRGCRLHEYRHALVSIQGGQGREQSGCSGERGRQAAQEGRLRHRHWAEGSRV